MRINDRLGRHVRIQAAVLGTMLLAMLGALLVTTAEPASAATVMKGSTRCVGKVVRRCVYLEAYWRNGKRYVRAVGRIHTGRSSEVDWVDHISLRRNNKRVTSRYNSGVEIIRTHGTHRNGQYHGLARFCWGPADHVRCRWLEGRSRYFRH